MSSSPRTRTRPSSCESSTSGSGAPEGAVPMGRHPSRRALLRVAAGAVAVAVSPRPRRATAQTPVTVKYLTWWWAEKGRNEAWRGIVKRFHDAQRDIRIQEVGFPYSEFFQRVTTQLAGGRLDADV